jgi:hypothetical protein
VQDAGLPCSLFHRQGTGLTAISGGSMINRPTFVLVLRPEKGVDAVRALRVHMSAFAPNVRR